MTETNEMNTFFIKFTVGMVSDVKNVGFKMGNGSIILHTF